MSSAVNVEQRSTSDCFHCLRPRHLLISWQRRLRTRQLPHRIMKRIRWNFRTFELSNFGSMFRGLAGSTGMYSHGTFWQSSLIELQSGQAEGKYQGISWPFAKKTSASSWLLKFLFGIHIAVRIVTINLEIKVWRFFNVQIEISYYNLQPCLTMFLSFFIGSSPFCMLSRSLWWPASTPQSSLQAEYHEYLMITYDYLDGELL